MLTGFSFLRKRAHESGVVIIEFALMIGVVLLVVAGTLDYGLFIINSKIAHGAIHSAARSGAGKVVPILSDDTGQIPQSCSDLCATTDTPLFPDPPSVQIDNYLTANGLDPADFPRTVRVVPLDILEVEDPGDSDSINMDFLEIVIRNNASCAFCFSRILPPVGVEQRALFPVACKIGESCPP